MSISLWSCATRVFESPLLELGRSVTASTAKYAPFILSTSWRIVDIKSMASALESIVKAIQLNDYVTRMLIDWCYVLRTYEFLSSYYPCCRRIWLQRVVFLWHISQILTPYQSSHSQRRYVSCTPTRCIAISLVDVFTDRIHLGWRKLFLIRLYILISL